MLYHGDALDILKTLDDNSIDSIITDPPYGYAFMNKAWDKAVVSVDIWKECLRVLKHGAFAAIMSSPRQDVLSRMVVNLQDAGFRTDFTSLYHTYASGFPKSSNIAKMIDKRLGFKGEIIGQGKGSSLNHRNKINKEHGFRPNDYYEDKDNTFNYTKPVSEQAKVLDGSYAGFQPKPAVEVILMVMKPLSEKTFVDQALSNGKGCTWLEDCRIPFDKETDTQPRIREDKRLFSSQTHEIYGKLGRIENHQYFNEQGRFPANLLVSDDVLNDGRITKGKVGANGYWGFQDKKGWNKNDIPYYSKEKDNQISDSGSYSRYFSLDKWFDTTFPFLAIPKASSSEKNKGLDQWIGRPREGNRTRTPDYDGKFPCSDYRPSKGNWHPTVKPIKLMSWLVTLLSRPQDTILDPFMGSGTTCIAAKLLKRNYIGIEKELEYLEIARQRIKAY